MTDREDIGRQFEEDFAEEIGLERVPGSGNQWHSKLDVRGRGTVWTLKATRSARMSGNDFVDALMHTFGPGGDGRLPFMALRFFADSIGEMDLVVMRKQDFFALTAGELDFKTAPGRSEERRARSKVPQLLREE